jgi:hypothetical protein
MELGLLIHKARALITIFLIEYITLWHFEKVLCVCQTSNEKHPTMRKLSGGSADVEARKPSHSQFLPQRTLTAVAAVIEWKEMNGPKRITITLYEEVGHNFGFRNRREIFFSVVTLNFRVGKALGWVGSR